MTRAPEILLQSISHLSKSIRPYIYTESKNILGAGLRYFCRF